MFYDGSKNDHCPCLKQCSLYTISQRLEYWVLGRYVVWKKESNEWQGIWKSELKGFKAYMEMKPKYNVLRND